MANLQEIVKVTQSQYNTLASGGTVGSYTGLNDNYIYLVEQEQEYIPTAGGEIIDDGYLGFLDSNDDTRFALGADAFSDEIIYKPSDKYMPLFADDDYQLIYSDNGSYWYDFTFSTKQLHIYDADDTANEIYFDTETGTIGHSVNAGEYWYEAILPQQSGTLALTSDVNNKATVWNISNTDPDGLATWLNNNDTKIKTGDILNLPQFEDVGIISYKNNNDITIKIYNTDIILEESYRKQNGQWSLLEENEVSVGGTKLYRHIIEYSTGDTLYCIASISNIAVNTDDLVALFNNMHNMFCESQNYGAGVVLSFSGASFKYMDETEGVIIITMPVGTTFTDTVTPL